MMTDSPGAVNPCADFNNPPESCPECFAVWFERRSAASGYLLEFAEAGGVVGNDTDAIEYEPEWWVCGDCGWTHAPKGGAR